LQIYIKTTPTRFAFNTPSSGSFLFTWHHSYVVGPTRRRSPTWVTWFSWLVTFYLCVTVCTECAMYGVGWFMTRCWISHQLFLPQMC